MIIIVSQITSVFTELANWLATYIPLILQLFYTPGTGDSAGQLTFLGTLVVISLGISIFFLIMRLIENFFHLRT